MFSSEYKYCAEVSHANRNDADSRDIVCVIFDDYNGVNNNKV